jgi:capsid portal protein
MPDEFISSGGLSEADLVSLVQKASSTGGAFSSESSDGEPVIDEIFITDNDEALSGPQLVASLLASSLIGFDHGRLISDTASSGVLSIAKGVDGSTQSQAEIGESRLSVLPTVSPPYPPELLMAFLQADATHSRCCRAKVTDAVGRDYRIIPTTMPDGSPYDPSTNDEIIRKVISSELKDIRNFISECNEVVGFDATLELAGLDYEAIGWAAIEVIRSPDMKVRRLSHIPASRVRVLHGWKGFVEKLDDNKFTYYQPFGDKVVSKSRVSPVDGSKEPFNPREDGELGVANADWRLIDRDTGEPTNDLFRSANEIIWITKSHPCTIYYGFSDVIPAVGDLLANANIRDYLLQFFEHNTVPRYAIIIEGAKVAQDVKEAIVSYFRDHVRGKAHKTLIIPIPAMRGEVKIRFEKLASDNQEASFNETKKNNNQGIMVAHGVSPAIIGVNDAASLGSGKGLSQAEIYKDRIIAPSQRRFEFPLNRLFRLGLGVRVVSLKFNPLDIRDLEAEMKVNLGYLERGCTTINQVIQSAGLGDPIEGGDRAFIMIPNFGVMFVDDLSVASSEDRRLLEAEVTKLKIRLLARRYDNSIKDEQLYSDVFHDDGTAPDAPKAPTEPGDVASGE